MFVDKLAFQICYKHTGMGEDWDIFVLYQKIDGFEK